MLSVPYDIDKDEATFTLHRQITQFSACHPYYTILMHGNDYLHDSLPVFPFLVINLENSGIIIHGDKYATGKVLRGISG